KTLALAQINRLKSEGRSTSKLEALLEGVREQETKLDKVGHSDSEDNRNALQVVEIVLKQLATEIEKEIPSDHHHNSTDHSARGRLDSLIEKTLHKALGEIDMIRGNGSLVLTKNLENLVKE